MKEKVAFGIGSAIAAGALLLSRDRSSAEQITLKTQAPTPVPTPVEIYGPEPICEDFELRWGEPGETVGTDYIGGDPLKCVGTMVLESVELSGEEFEYDPESSTSVSVWLIEPAEEKKEREVSRVAISLMVGVFGLAAISGIWALNRIDKKE